MPHIRNLEEARGLSGLSHADLWMRYFALGGTASKEHTKAFLNASRVLETAQQDVLAHALNERFYEMGQNHPVFYPGDSQGT